MLQDNRQFNRESIIISIVQKRNEMIRLASSNGLLNRETIRCSQELDKLLNAFNNYKN